MACHFSENIIKCYSSIPLPFFLICHFFHLSAPTINAYTTCLLCFVNITINSSEVFCWIGPLTFYHQHSTFLFITTNNFFSFNSCKFSINTNQYICKITVKDLSSKSNTKLIIERYYYENFD